MHLLYTHIQMRADRRGQLSAWLFTFIEVWTPLCSWHTKRHIFGARSRGHSARSRGHAFQATMKPSSENEIKAPSCGEFSKTRLYSSSENEVFKREWQFRSTENIFIHELGPWGSSYRGLQKYGLHVPLVSSFWPQTPPPPLCLLFVSSIRPTSLPPYTFPFPRPVTNRNTRAHSHYAIYPKPTPQFGCFQNGGTRISTEQQMWVHSNETFIPTSSLLRGNVSKFFENLPDHPWNSSSSFVFNMILQIIFEMIFVKFGTLWSSKSSRRLWLFVGYLRGFPRKTRESPGKIAGIFPEARKCRKF